MKKESARTTESGEKESFPATSKGDRTLELPIVILVSTKMATLQCYLAGRPDDRLTLFYHDTE